MGFDVIAVDTGADKQKLCEGLGANHFVDFKMAVHPCGLRFSSRRNLTTLRLSPLFRRTSSTRSTS